MVLLRENRDLDYRDVSGDGVEEQCLSPFICVLQHHVCLPKLT